MMEHVQISEQWQHMVMCWQDLETSADEGRAHAAGTKEVGSEKWEGCLEEERKTVEHDLWLAGLDASRRRLGAVQLH